MDVATICNDTFNFDNSFAFVTRNTFGLLPRTIHLWVLGTLSLHSPFQDVFFFQCCCGHVCYDLGKCFHHTLFFLSSLWQLSTLQHFVTKLGAVGISTLLASTFDISEAHPFCLRGMIFIACMHSSTQCGMTIKTNQQCMKVKLYHF